MQIYTAQHLPEFFLDLLLWDDKPETWSAEKFADRLPCLYRYRRLKALAQAFDVAADLSELNNAGFLYRREKPDYSKLEAEIEKQLIQKRGEQFFTQKKRKWGICPGEMEATALYKHLFRFVEFTWQLTRFEDESPANAMPYSIFATDITAGFFSETQQEKISYCKRLLGLLIDPQERSFTEKELMEKFGFPEGDVKEIDEDWFNIG